MNTYRHTVEVDVITLYILDFLKNLANPRTTASFKTTTFSFLPFRYGWVGWYRYRAIESRLSIFLPSSSDAKSPPLYFHFPSPESCPSALPSEEQGIESLQFPNLAAKSIQVTAPEKNRAWFAHLPSNFLFLHIYQEAWSGFAYIFKSEMKEALF